MKNKVLYAAISAALMSPLSAHAVNILIPNDAKQSTYAVNLVSHVGKTWTYSVSQVQGRTLSHWVLGINNCLSNVTSSSPSHDQLGADPSTDAKFVGIKWNTAGGTFSFTLDKEYAETTLQAFVKTATVYNTGNITGPDCSKPVSSTTDAAAKAAAEKAAADAAAKAAADKAAADAAAKAAAEKAAADAAKAAADKAAADKEAADKKAAADKEAADKAAAAKSEAEKAAAEKEASDKKATAEKEAADKKAAIEKAAAEKALADKVAAEKDKADKEAENKKASAKSEAEKEAAEKEASDKKAASEKEAADKNAANNESSDKKAKAEKEAADKKAEADKEASDKKAATNSEADKDAADKEAAAKKAVVEKEAADKKAEADKEAADKRAKAEKESADKKAAAEKEAASKQTPEKAAIDNDAADKKANAEKEAADKKAAADKDCANKKANIEKEAADKKANLKTDAEKEAVDKEAEDKKTAADKDCASKKGDLDKEASDKKDAADKEASDKKDASDKAKSDKEAADKAQADKAKSDKDAADKAQADKEKSDKEAADKAKADKAKADKEAADKADKEKADKEAADKAKADKEKATKDAVGKTSNTLCASSANMDSYAFSNSQGHSAWIPGIATDLVFADDAPGHFTENTDGTAKFTGNLARRGDAKQGLIVDVTFTGAQATAPGEPKKELNAKAYNEGKADMSKWYFYTGFEGTLTGTGNYEGGKIHIVRMGPAFQIGNGANGKNINFGASGWFSYDIVSQPSNRKYVFYKTSEHADFNVDLSPCSEKGTATSPASSVDSEGKSKHSNASFGLRVTTPRASGNDLEVEQDDDISVDTSIIADSEHVGKTADIIMVGIYGNKAFVRDGDDWKEWDGKLEHLTAAKKGVTLPSSPLPANVLKGKMKGMSGSCEVRVGYRVDGKLIYNDEALKFTVKK